MIRQWAPARLFEEALLTRADQAIRAQLIVPEQRELFDYWRSKSIDGAYPMRADIQPGELRAMLPSLSLLDVIAESEDTVRLRVRLAGTRLRDYFGVETTGHFLDEYDLGDQTEYWNAAYREVIGVGRPAQGVIALDAWKQPNVFQFWLRLPLVNDEGQIAMVLGHDAFLQSEKAHALAERANLRIA
ncbi:MAG: PAS domain-containing protein [Parvibaculum sp.]|nr:PAS domain-containing protein [Parvibaculum sp.]